MPRIFNKLVKTMHYLRLHKFVPTTLSARYMGNLRIVIFLF